MSEVVIEGARAVVRVIPDRGMRRRLAFAPDTVSIEVRGSIAADRTGQIGPTAFAVRVGETIVSVSGGGTPEDLVVDRLKLTVDYRTAGMIGAEALAGRRASITVAGHFGQRLSEDEDAMWWDVDVMTCTFAPGDPAVASDQVATHVLTEGGSPVGLVRGTPDAVRREVARRLRIDGVSLRATAFPIQDLDA